MSIDVTRTPGNANVSVNHAAGPDIGSPPSLVDVSFPTRQLQVAGVSLARSGTRSDVTILDTLNPSELSLVESELSRRYACTATETLLYAGRNCFRSVPTATGERLREERLLDNLIESQLRPEKPRIGAESVLFTIPCDFGRRVAAALGAQPGNLLIDRFANSETRIEVRESVRDRHAFVVASLSEPVNEGLKETELLVQALKLADAKRITVILPYFAYGRQDRKVDIRPPISARAVTDTLASMGADQILTVDIHAAQIEGFFRGPFENLSGLSQIIPTLLKDEGNDLVVVSPDAGGSKRAEKFSREVEQLGSTFAPLVIMSKFRPGPGQKPRVTLTVDRDQLAGKTCVLVDDILDTGGSILAAATALKEYGAARVVVCITHPVCSRDALAKLRESRMPDGMRTIDSLYVTDTLAVREPRSDFLKVVSVAPLIAEAVTRLASPRGSLRELRERTNLGLELPALPDDKTKVQ